jgi:hypothetical protein
MPNHAKQALTFRIKIIYKKHGKPVILRNAEFSETVDLFPVIAKLILNRVLRNMKRNKFSWKPYYIGTVLPCLLHIAKFLCN